MTLLQKFKYTFIKQLVILHSGNILLKLKSTIILVTMISPFAYLMESLSKWYINNQDYIYFVLGTIIIDHLIGSYYHLFIKKDFTPKKNAIGIAVKIGLVTGMGFIFEGLGHIIKEQTFVYNYLLLILRLMVFLYPAGSAAMNSAEITGGRFPPIGAIKWMKKFNTDLKLPKNE